MLAAYKPKIAPLFELGPTGTLKQLHCQAVEQMFERVLPPQVFAEAPTTEAIRQQQKDFFYEFLPLFTWSKFTVDQPCDISFFLICKFRPLVFKFFFDMVTRWLIPGKPLNADLFFAMDFRLPEYGDEIYTAIEISVRVSQVKDMEQIRRNLVGIESDVRLGAESVYQASRIMELKGLSVDQKTALIQEQIAQVIRRRPAVFDQDIFREMQHFLVNCKPEFKAIREYRHMSRIISIAYVFRRELTTRMAQDDKKRHLYLKLFRVKLYSESAVRGVLGLCVGVNFLHDNEILESEHILKVVRGFIPTAQMVAGSYLAHFSPGSSLCTQYLELEHADRSLFSLQEQALLRRELPAALKDRITQMMHPIFMSGNEEEVMRNIVTLSKQLKFKRDLPQVIASFEQQTSQHVVFLVILLRVRLADSSIEEQLEPMNAEMDRVKQVGFIRKKYPKEAAVFRVQLAKESFIREDFSLDLQKARRQLMEQLMCCVGEVRDYNGGMLSKQNEVLQALRQMSEQAGEQHDFLLENFFHSLMPAVMRSTMEPQSLHKLFLLMLSCLESAGSPEEHVWMRQQQDAKAIYMMVAADHESIGDFLAKRVSRLHIAPMQLVSVQLVVYGLPCMGFIYKTQDLDAQEEFAACVQASIGDWSNR